MPVLPLCRVLAGLQPHARHEHHRCPTAHGGDEGIVAADMRPSAIAEPSTTAGTRISGAHSRKSHQTRENDHARPRRRSLKASMLLPRRYHTTRTQNSRVVDQSRAIAQGLPRETLERLILCFCGATLEGDQSAIPAAGCAFRLDYISVRYVPTGNRGRHLLT
jgi:hypothetical protein